MDSIQGNLNMTPPASPPDKAKEGEPEAAGIIGKIGDTIGGAIDKVEDTVKGAIEGVHHAADDAVAAVKKKAKEKLDNTREGIGKVVDPPLYQERIQIPLDHESYKTVTLDQATVMLGYFTQKMQNQGFPWALYRVDDRTRLKKRARVSDLEALRRLQNGQEVLFQPDRNMKLDLSPENLTAAAKIGGGQLKPMEDIATLSKDTKVSPGNVGFEVKFGAPIFIKSFGELKLLHELYNPEAKLKEPEKPKEPSKIIIIGHPEPEKPPEPENTFGKTAHNLSYFTEKTLGSAYPWRFVKDKEGSTFWRIAKSMYTKGIPGALIGGAVGLAIGGPIGLFTRVWATAITLTTYGAIAGGALMSVQGARDAVKGEEINAFETLSRILDSKPVMLQERKMHSINVPVLGNFSWYSDYGKGSIITNPSDLEIFSKMQDQDTTK